MLLHRLAMATFQPINKSMQKPIVANVSPDPPVTPAAIRASTITFEAFISNFPRSLSSQAEPGKENTKKSSVVVVSAKRLASTSFKSSQKLHVPPQKKRKTMKGTSKAVREQAVRAVKLMPTVEGSAATSSAYISSMSSTGPESDSTWSIGSTHLGELDSDMSPQTTNRRNLCHRPSTTSSSRTRTLRPSQHKVSVNAVKREGPASPDRPTIRRRSLSLSKYSKETRERKLQEEEVVELPPVEWAYQGYVRAKKEKLVMKELWMKELRKQKGQEAERGPESSACKRRLEAERERQKVPKRHKKSHKKVDEQPLADLQPVQKASSQPEHPLMDSRRDQSGNTALLEKQSKMMTNEGSHPVAVVPQPASKSPSRGSNGAALKGDENLISQPRDSDKDVVLKRSTGTMYIPTGPKALRRKKKQNSRHWQQNCDKREVENATNCLTYSQASSDGVEKGNKGLSFEQIARRRQQSSIAPRTFYGKCPEYPVPPIFDSSPSITEMALTNENKHRDAERSESAKDRMTPPDSSPASKGSKTSRESKNTHVPFEIHVDDDWRTLLDDDDPMFSTPKPSSLNQAISSVASSDDGRISTSPTQSNRGVTDLRTKSGPQTLSKGQSLSILSEKLSYRGSLKKYQSHPKVSQCRRGLSVLGVDDISQCLPIWLAGLLLSMERIPHLYLRHNNMIVPFRN